MMRLLTRKRINLLARFNQSFHLFPLKTLVEYTQQHWRLISILMHQLDKRQIHNSTSHQIFSKSTQKKRIPFKKIDNLPQKIWSLVIVTSKVITSKIVMQQSVLCKISKSLHLLSLKTKKAPKLTIFLKLKESWLQNNL